MDEKNKLIDLGGLAVFKAMMDSEVDEKIAAAGIGVLYEISKNDDGEIVLTGTDGTETKVTDNNTTYGFSQDGATLTITPSEGEPITVTLGEEITFAKVVTALGYTPSELIISSTQPTSQISGEWLEVLN